MTIKYCDYALGNDTTGDGSAANPYKTIDKASLGLAGGDEVRCAKSPDSSDLPGTLTWTNNSSSVATSQDLTGVLAARNFIRKTTLQSGDYDIWWEISSINATTITLVQQFRGYTESCSSKKLGTTDTGAATSGQNVQSISSSGSSRSSQIKVSGGWNLATETQDGETWFWQSGASKYGTGMNPNSKNYIKLSKCNFLRYNYDLYLYSEAGWTVEYCQVLSAGSVPFYSSVYMADLVVSHLTSNGTIRLGYGVSWSIIAEDILCVNGTIYLYGFTKTIVANNATIWANTGSITQGISGASNTLNLFIPSKLYNVSGVSTIAVQSGSIMGPWYATLKYIDGMADERAYQLYGYARKDTADARSGACVNIIPNNASKPFEQILRLAAAASTAKTVGIYMKKNASFNGTVQAALMFKGKFLVDFATWTMTTSYQQFTLTAQAVDIDESGVLELWIRVTGTVGSVFADDLS